MALSAKQPSRRISCFRIIAELYVLENEPCCAFPCLRVATSFAQKAFLDGPRAPSVIKVRSSLVKMLLDHGGPIEEAREVAESNLINAEVIFGPYHPETSRVQELYDRTLLTYSE